MGMGEFKGAERCWPRLHLGVWVGAGGDRPDSAPPGCHPGSRQATQAPLAAATWAATSAAKSSTFFSMPSPTMYIVKPLTWVPVAFR